MKLFIHITMLIIISTFLPSCSNISCHSEVGLDSNISCKGVMGNPKKEMFEKMSRLNKLNYNGFYYYNHEKYINLAKECIRNYTLNKNIEVCSNVVMNLDKFCFDKKSIYACQYIYEVQRDILKNTKYSMKIYKYAKNNNIRVHKDFSYFTFGNSITNIIDPYKDYIVNSNIYPFLLLDKNINRHIDKNEIIDFVKSVEAVISKNSGKLNKNFYDELSYYGIDKRHIDDIYKIFKICISTSKNNSFYISELKKCLNKEDIFNPSIYNKNSISIAEMLSINYIKIYKNIPLHEDYLLETSKFYKE